MGTSLLKHCSKKKKKKSLKTLVTCVCLRMVWWGDVVDKEDKQSKPWVFTFWHPQKGVGSCSSRGLTLT